MLIHDTKPFNPKKWPFFYGHWIVFCSIIGMLCSAPGQTLGVSVFTDYLINNLQISRLMLSISYMIGTIGSSLVIGRIGGLIDVVGIRVVAAFSSVGLGLVLFYLSRVDIAARSISDFSGAEFYTAIAVISVTAGFMLLRFFGQGVIALTSRIMLMEWFIKKRGRATGIAGLFTSLVFAGAPVVFEFLIRKFGWRGAWVTMGLFVGIGFTAFVLYFYRDKPENCGLLPDGYSEKDPGAQENAEEVNWTLPQAKRTYAFRIYNLSLAMFSLVVTAITFHLVSIFKMNGLTRDVAISIYIPAAVIAVVVNFVGGLVSDFIKLKYLLIVLNAGLLLSCSGAMLLHTPVGYFLLILGNGLSSGLFATLASVTWPRFFGREHLGAISGYSMAFLVFFSAIGPFLFGLSFDFSGNYFTAILVCTLIVILLLLGSLKADAPNPDNI